MIIKTHINQLDPIGNILLYYIFMEVLCSSLNSKHLLAPSINIYESTKFVHNVIAETFNNIICILYYSLTLMQYFLRMIIINQLHLYLYNN